jgi:hypothetical protein
MDICIEQPPEFFDLGGIHRMRCYLAKESGSQTVNDGVME